MKRKEKERDQRIHPKYIYIFFSILCAILVVLSFKFSDRLSGVKATVGDIIVSDAEWN